MLGAGPVLATNQRLRVFSFPFLRWSAYQSIPCTVLFHVLSLLFGCHARLMPIQNCLPDNKLELDRIFSIRGLVTYDWRDVGDRIRSRAGELVQIQSAIKMQILFLNLFATAPQRNLGRIVP